MIKALLPLCLAFALAPCFGSEDEVPDSSAAIPADTLRSIEVSTAQVRKLRQVYEDTAKKEAERLCLVLKRAQDQAARANNLALAMALKKRIAEYQAGGLVVEVDDQFRAVTDGGNTSKELPEIRYIDSDNVPGTYQNPVRVPQGTMATAEGIEEPMQVIDGDLDTLVKLPKGRSAITITFPVPMNPGILVIYQRDKGAGVDTIVKGKVIVNDRCEIPFANFASAHVMLIDLKTFAYIKKIEFITQECVNSPGIKEIYLR